MFKQYHYGNLRSMTQEYLERTITEYYERLHPNWQVFVTIQNTYEDLLGDDMVEIVCYTKRGNERRLDNHVSTICYEIAEVLSCPTRI